MQRFKLTFIVSLCLATAMAFFSLQTLNAQGKGKGKGKGVGPCHEDLQKYCKKVKPGEGRLVKCLLENKNKLTPECKANLDKRLAKAKAHMKKINAACKEDAKKICKDVKPGKGRIIQCLRKNEASLSVACKDALKPKKPEKPDDGVNEEVHPEE